MRVLIVEIRVLNDGMYVVDGIHALMDGVVQFFAEQPAGRLSLGPSKSGVVSAGQSAGSQVVIYPSAIGGCQWTCARIIMGPRSRRRFGSQWPWSRAAAVPGKGLAYKFERRKSEVCGETLNINIREACLMRENLRIPRLAVVVGSPTIFIPLLCVSVSLCFCRLCLSMIQ